jgi:hypothetical protein
MQGKLKLYCLCHFAGNTRKKLAIKIRQFLARLIAAMTFLAHSVIHPIGMRNISSAALPFL